ncbi:MAG: peptidylprolyl isomerase [Sphingomonadales bacterium]
MALRKVLGAMMAFLMAGGAGLTMSDAEARTMADLDLENVLYLELDHGRVVIEMYPESAPNHVRRIKELVRDEFYDGLTFHRVIDGFMAQTGDPVGDGSGGSGQNLDAEFNDRMHLRGTVSMARAGDPNSADSQFFICLAPSFSLNGQYTVWGRVLSGMEHVDQIKRGEGRNFVRNGDPDKIVSMRIAADVEKADGAQANSAP